MNIRKFGFIAACFMFTACSINPTYTALSSTSDGSPLDDIFIYRKYEYLIEWYETKITALIRINGFKQFVKDNNLICNEDMSLCKKELCVRYKILSSNIIYKYEVNIYNKTPTIIVKTVPVLTKEQAIKEGFYSKKNFDYFLNDQFCRSLIHGSEFR